MELGDMISFALVIVIAIGALFMIQAGGAVYGLGMVIFIVAVVAGFWLVKRFFDRQDTVRH